ncbi:MAG TPA: YwpF family protein [Bacillus sp. (in: firmicutes)]|nr:YwpF family protein [Bacillus sp. (in: firmicutes)]
MKTFKLVALEIKLSNAEDEAYHSLELIDGLIINKETEENNWIIEALLPNTSLPYFEEIFKQKEPLKLQATISKKSNDPANFTANIIDITKMESQFSLLLEGVLTGRRILLPEMILKNLIDLGLNGQSLLQEFTRQLNEKRKRSAF